MPVHLVILVLVCAAAATAPAAAEGVVPAHKPGYRRPVPVFKISAFKDISAYVLEQTQAALKGRLDVQLKWVKNADEAHSDLRTGKAALASMSYDDTLSLALQENFTQVVAAWPVHGSIMSLCGKIDVASGKVRVGIDTDTGYARMLRQVLKKTLSPADYAAIKWVYAGATNLRYEKLAAGELDATLLNAPFTSFLPASVSCQAFYKLTGPIQGTVGNIRRSELTNRQERQLLSTFLGAFKQATWAMRNNPAAAKAGLAKFYNVTDAVADKIYGTLWGVDGIQTSFCFEYDRLANVESIFNADTGIPIPAKRFWVEDWGCSTSHGGGSGYGGR